MSLLRHRQDGKTKQDKSTEKNIFFVLMRSKQKSRQKMQVGTYFVW